MLIKDLLDVYGNIQIQTRWKNRILLDINSVQEQI